MVSAREIIEKIASFLAQGIDLDTFEDWIVQNTWNVHQWGNDDEQFLSYSLELQFSEHSSGHLDEKRMRNEISVLLANFSLRNLSIEAFQKQTTACNSIAPRPVFQPQFSGKVFAMEF